MFGDVNNIIWKYKMLKQVICPVECSDCSVAALLDSPRLWLHSHQIYCWVWNTAFTIYFQWDRHKPAGFQCSLSLARVNTSKCRQFPDVCCMCERALPRCYLDLNFVTLPRVHVWIEACVFQGNARLITSLAHAALILFCLSQHWSCFNQHKSYWQHTA